MRIWQTFYSSIKIFAAVIMKQMLTHFDYRISTVKKKGNVLYMKGDWIFPKSMVSGLFNGTGLILSEEWFFIGTKDDGLVARVMVPTVDGRSRAYDWINRWLSDFKVVL